MAITSVIPDVGFYPESTFTINGSGFGASPSGAIYLVAPDDGTSTTLTFAGWSDTQITGVQVPGEEDLLDLSASLPFTAVVVVRPFLISPSGLRSDPVTVGYDPTPPTVYPDGSLIVALEPVEIDGGPELAPVLPAFGAAVGRITEYDGPDYDVLFYEFDDDAYELDAGSGDLLPTQFYVVGPLSQDILGRQGIVLTTEVEEEA